MTDELDTDRYFLVSLFDKVESTTMVFVTVVEAERMSYLRDMALRDNLSLGICMRLDAIANVMRKLEGPPPWTFDRLTPSVADEITRERFESLCLRRKQTGALS